VAHPSALGHPGPERGGPRRQAPGTRAARQAPGRTAAPAGGEGSPRLPRPFLKWAGGKRQLLPELRRFYPRRFGRYFEPFLGSGAVFFDLAAAGALESREVTLADINPDVVGCYEALRTRTSALIRHLGGLAATHAEAPVQHYYEVRDGRFNPLRQAVMIRRQTGGARRWRYPVELAAMLIYLNRTGFNGLFRLNSRGAFNVPAGRYANPRICDEPTLRAAARALSGGRVRLTEAAFDEVLADARCDDFVYLDPPYAPLSATSSFTGYTEGGFGETDQRRLRDVVVALASRGCHVLLSNSTAPLVRALYEQERAAARAGLRVHRVRARRAINSRGAGRGPIDELLVTNVAPRRGRPG
jgi:DNA adenine methylase